MICPDCGAATHTVDDSRYRWTQCVICVWQTPKEDLHQGDLFSQPPDPDVTITKIYDPEIGDIDV